MESKSSTHRWEHHPIALILLVGLGFAVALRAPDACVGAPSGLVSWWRAEGNLLDSVGTNNGVALGTISFNKGEMGQAFVFDGVSSIKVPASPSLDVGQGSGFTIEAWINPTNLNLQELFEWNQNNGVPTGAAQIGVHMEINESPGDGSIWGNIVDTFGSSHNFHTTNGLVMTNTFQHVAMTYDKASGLAFLYWNGLQVASASVGPFATPQTSFDFFMGSRPSGFFTNIYFQGEIDEPALYNRALSQGEVQAIYNSGSPTCVPPPSGLVGWWRGESNALDGAGFNSGIPTNIAYSAGEVGEAFYFNGSDSSYIRIPANPSLDVGQTNGFTLEFWCNPPSTNETVVTLAEWNDNSGTLTGIGCHLEFYSAGRILGDIVDPSTGNDHYLMSAGGDVTPNVWQHVAMTYDKTTGVMTLYRNGVLIANGNVGIWRPSTRFDLYLGIRSAGVFAPIPYQGLLDEVSLYNRVLSAAELLAIYNADSAGKCPTANIAPTITSQPKSLSLLQGTNAFFSVAAQGTPPLRYQWFFNSNSLTGKTNSFLILTNVQASQQGNYSVTVTNVFGKAVSSNAFLTVLPPPVCIPPPSGIVAWWRAESDMVDSIGTNHALPQGLQNPEMLYDAAGKVGTAFVFDHDHNGLYLQVPASDDLNVGPGVGFTVEGWILTWAYGSTQPLLLWSDSRNVGVGLFLNFNNAPGTIAAHFTDTNTVHPRKVVLVGPALITDFGWQHVALTFDRVSGLATLYVDGHSVAQTNLGSFTPLTKSPVYMGFSPVIDPPIVPTHFPDGEMDEFSIYNRALSALEIQSIVQADKTGKCTEAPFIITQPVSQRVTENFSATFSVAASGTPNLHYQWRFKGVPIPGATATSFTVASVQPSDTGPYSVLITNAFGLVLSSNAALTINLPPEPIITVSPLAKFPGDTNLVVIAACGPSALVAFDGSKSGEPADPLFSYAWYEVTKLFSTNVVATNLLAVGNHQITLFVDDHMPGGTNSARVRVQIVSLADAVGLVIDLVEGSGLSHVQPLLAALNAAANSFTRGDTTSGANQLGAFENKVQAQVMPDNPAMATSFLQAAQQILDASRRCDSPRIAHGQIVSLARHQDGKFYIKLSGGSAGVQLVEASTNLVDWVVVGVATQKADGAYDFEDANAVNLPNRFYRIVPLHGP
jgi:hypothetical protein